MKFGMIFSTKVSYKIRKRLRCATIVPARKSCSGVGLSNIKWSQINGAWISRPYTFQWSINIQCVYYVLLSFNISGINHLFASGILLWIKPVLDSCTQVVIYICSVCDQARAVITCCSTIVQISLKFACHFFESYWISAF